MTKEQRAKKRLKEKQQLQAKDTFKPFTDQKRKSPIWNKPKSNRIDDIRRMPRPNGLTHLCKAYQDECKGQDNQLEVPKPPNPIPNNIQPKTQKETILLRINKIVYSNYIGQCLWVVDYDDYGIGRPRNATLDEVALILGQSRNKVMDRLNKMVLKSNNYMDQEDQGRLSRDSLNSSFLKSLNLSLKAEKWLDTLMALGMARNMPIGILKELNGAFNMVGNIQKLGLEHIKLMVPSHESKGTTLNNQTNINIPTNGTQFLDTTMAVNLLNNNNQNLINESTKQAIYLIEDIASGPNVIATSSDAQMSIVKNKIFTGHETRRQDEYGTITEIIPEGPDGQPGLGYQPPIGYEADK